MVFGFSKGQEDYTFHLGTLNPDFQPVLDAFKKNFEYGFQTGVQFVVYHRGKKVIDITGSSKAMAEKGYSSDSVQVVFSSGKTIAALVIAWLVDQGKLDYDKPVAEYWPEFAANGKEKICVKDVLRHDSGLAFLSTKITREMLLEKPPKALVKAIEESKPAWKYVRNLKEGDRIYHAASRGLILDEICRRVDEKKRSIGQIVSEVMNQKVAEIVKPRDSEEKSDSIFMFCGKHNIPDSELQEVFPKRYFPHRFQTVPKALWNKFIQKILHIFRQDPLAQFRKNLPNDLIKRSNDLKAKAKKQKVKPLTNKALKSLELGKIMTDPDSMLELETPSASFIANAGSLAAYGQAFVLADASKRILNENTLNGFFSEPVSKFDFFLGFPTTLSKGGVGVFRDAWYPEFMHSFVGWQGFGGSGFAFSKEFELSVAVVPNKYKVLTIGAFREPRCLGVMESLMEVIQKLKNQEKSLVTTEMTQNSEVAKN